MHCYSSGGSLGTATRMLSTERPCHMIQETDWDHLLRENDVDCSAINWHKKFKIMSVCMIQGSIYWGGGRGGKLPPQNVNLPPQTFS